jgi:hypothetical protein
MILPLLPAAGRPDFIRAAFFAATRRMALSKRHSLQLKSVSHTFRPTTPVCIQIHGRPACDTLFSKWIDVIVLFLSQRDLEGLADTILIRCSITPSPLRERVGVRV